MKKYYLHNGTEQQGPFDLEELKNRNITRQTPIWYDGLSDWTVAEKLEELNSLFISTPPSFKSATPPQVERASNLNPTFQEQNGIKKNKSIYLIIGSIIILGLIGFLIYQNLNLKKNLSETTASPVKDSVTIAQNTSGNNIVTEIKDSVAPKIQIREGRHDFTLQWITFDDNRTGSVYINKLSDNTYSIEGEQIGQQKPVGGNVDTTALLVQEYIKIKGIITPISQRELLFDGDIIYVVAGNNNGNPCRKSGKNIFKSSGQRKYWRLQNMTNCEGGMVTDYVDIFF